VIRFDHVSLRYGNGPEVLRDLSFTLPPGSFHFLTGASGAGKSSVLRLIYLAQRPSSGEISLSGTAINSLERDQLPPLRRKIGVVFQNFRLIDHLSVLDNVALPLRMAGEKESVIQQYVVELLRWVGLGNHMDARPSTLSGGQQQRVAIARSVVNRPRLLLADEPTGNVDDGIGERLLLLFEELNRLGTTVVIATHSETMIERFPHPRLHLEQGTVRVLPPVGPPVGTGAA